MSLLAEALQPSLVGGILGIGGRLEPLSLSDAITAQRAAYTLSFDVPTRSIHLDFRDANYVTSATASDCNRMATSCLQSASLSGEDTDEKYWMPWSMVRNYYSAFYGAHSVLRLLGIGCCWLDGDHLTHIDNLARATTGSSIPFSARPGAYKCFVDVAAGALIWSSAPGRPHEALWAMFHEVLGAASEQVIAGPLPQADAQTVFAKLESFRRIAASQGSSSWLSRTRNEIQYRLMHDVWHPTTISRQNRALLRRLTGQWAADPMDIDLDGASAHGNLGEFCCACAFVIALCRVLIVRISERNISGTRSFLTYGPLSYAHAARVAS